MLDQPTGHLHQHLSQPGLLFHSGQGLLPLFWSCSPWQSCGRAPFPSAAVTLGGFCSPFSPKSKNSKAKMDAFTVPTTLWADFPKLLGVLNSRLPSALIPGTLKLGTENTSSKSHWELYGESTKWIKDLHRGRFRQKGWKQTWKQVIDDAIHTDFTPLADCFQHFSPHREAFEPQSITELYIISHMYRHVYCTQYPLKCRVQPKYLDPVFSSCMDFWK